MTERPEQAGHGMLGRRRGFKERSETFLRKASPAIVPRACCKNTEVVFPPTHNSSKANYFSSTCYVLGKGHIVTNMKGNALVLMVLRSQHVRMLVGSSEQRTLHCILALVLQSCVTTDKVLSLTDYVCFICTMGIPTS
jgi:hypothetical protein